MSNVSKFREELEEFRDYCSANNVRFDEIVENLFEKKQRIRRPRLACKHYVYLLTVTMVMAICYGYWETLAVHCTAILRILMIQLLPLFDWRHLSQEQCLLRSLVVPTSGATTTTTTTTVPQHRIDCNFCESLSRVRRVRVDEVRAYYELHVPVLLAHRCRFDLDRLFDDDDDYLDSPICNIVSNFVREELFTVRDVARIFHYRSEPTDRLPFFFYHYRHCHFEDVKRFRKYFARPDILDDSLSPVQHSWLVVSRDYNATNFKQLMVADRLTVWVQIEGQVVVRLRPVRECRGDNGGGSCRDLETTVTEGSALIVSHFWDILYKPANSSYRNVAVVIEAH